ncbi:hypothetical protein Q7P35_000955 [Cladosporium inversicolor]
MATLLSLLPTSEVLQYYGPPDAATHHLFTSQHHHAPLESPPALEDRPNLGSLKPNHHHIATSSLHSPSTNQTDPQTKPNPLSIASATMPPDLCCINPPQRSLSPTEPARPPGSGSGAPLINLDGIFAVAALPNDHPHSLKVPLQDRRPPKHLVRSPSLVNKLRGQLRRRATVKSLRAEVWSCEGDENGDARVLTGGEIGEVGEVPTVRVGRVSPLHTSTELFGGGGLATGFEHPAALAGASAASSFSARRVSGTSDVELRELAYLNLDLARHQVDGLGDGRDGEADTTVGAAVGAALDEDADEDRIDHDQAAEKDELPASTIDEAPKEDVPPADHAKDDELVGVADANNDAPDTKEKARSESHNSFHLIKMQISQQLRSMSQLSDPSEESDRLTPDAWTFHRRERSGCFTPAATLGSIRARHMNHASESGVDSNNIPDSWGQVTREPDASSSIYSRPTSPEMPEPYEIPTDLAAVADWPLKSEGNSAANLSAQHDAAAANDQSSVQEEPHITIVEPDFSNLTTSESTQDAVNANDSSSATIPNRAPSHKSSSSSTTKHSRFLERFTPPKRLVRKRRSIFKFLRAGSRRNQTRSISTPVLCSPRLRPSVDGPADDNELLTVQYELTVPETNQTRSVSLNNLPSTAVNESQGVASSPDLRRKPSLAEYERHLSVSGDNRRRPSTKELHRLSQIEEDDRHEHVPTKKSLSYYSGTQETDPLMQAALERQLREKAMFHSPSKRSVPLSESSSMSFVATSWDEPSSAQPQSPERDPLDSHDKKPSAAHLSPPRTPVDGRPRTTSFSKQKQTNSQKPVILHTPSSVSRESIRSRIGSSLDSWSRYPSHTRGIRCNSAGSPDNVRTFDFALDIKHERIRGTGTHELDPFIPGRRVLTETSSMRASKRPLPKSRSATFGSFVRYYNNLFSSPDFHGKGRRTSVAAGGKLKHPELEILSPVLPAGGGTVPDMHADEMEQLRPGHMSHVKEQTAILVDKPKGTPPSKTELSSRDASPVPFRGNSVCVPHSPKHHTDAKATADNPVQSDGSEDCFSAEHKNSLTSPIYISDRNPNLDGTTETTDPVKRLTPSTAQAFSEFYKDCLIIPPSPATTAEVDAKAMPPPSLKPTKRGSPGGQAPQQFSLDPSAAVRRFPSVTVVDDRKGHWRSVSFISVQSSKSGASGASFVRESSNDLLKLMEMREREEREKLLLPVVV